MGILLKREECSEFPEAPEAYSGVLCRTPVCLGGLGICVGSSYSHPGPASLTVETRMVALLKKNLTQRLSESLASSPAPLAAQGRGSNWIHDSLVVVETSGCGFGVVALDPISAGTLVVMFGGIVITAAEFERLPAEMQNFPFQVADDLFLGPRDESDIGIGERINHSCAPNVGFSGAIALVALRDIAPGEEITLDYATCVASNDDAFVMECACGAPRCRRVVTGQDWRDPDVQARLLPYYQPFLQAKVESSRKGFAEVKVHRIAPIGNDDRVADAKPLRRLASSVVAAPRGVMGFVTEAIRQEWMAIPICVVAGLPSTLLTTAIMSAVAPVVATFEFARGDTAYISVISALASLVGYGTYLIAYYVGMLWKERRDWIRAGRINRPALRRKLRVCGYDFLAHLPSDFWVMPVMGAATGGLFVAGLTQFWSIVLAHTLADIAYAIKEPFFWHGAKKLVDWQESRASEIGSVTAPDRIV